MRISRSAEITDDLRRKIAAGEYQPGDRLPRLQELMELYETRSRSGLDRALRELETEGLLTVVHGGGIYVRRRHVVHRDLAAGLRTEYARALAGDSDQGLFETTTGTAAGTLEVNVQYDTVPAPGRVALTLRLEPEAPVLRRTFRYVIDGEPHQLAWSYVSTQTAEKANLKSADSERPGVGTIAQLYAAGIHVKKVRVEIETRMPVASEIADLAIPAGTPVYDHWRTMYEGSENSLPVEVSRGIIPGDRVAYVLNIELGGAE